MKVYIKEDQEEPKIGKYRCGECGNDIYKIYQNKKGIYTKCTSCGSKTYFTYYIPDIKLESSKHSDGCMCIF